MTTWQNILGVAAIGTGRQELTLPPSDSLLGRALKGLDASDREGALLGAVALASLHRQAGLRAATDNLPPPEACDADQLPRCNAAAGRHLARMLGGEFKEVLPEWLAALGRAGLRVPEEHLPALFDRATKTRVLRPLVLEVMGKRGRWLAAQNEAWGWASADLGPDTWETGGIEERLSLLRSLRATDPRAGRKLLLSTWKSEYAKDREAFLQTFIVGLSDEDEPFLQEAMPYMFGGDRSVSVWLTAGELLLQLPSSRLARRVLEQVSPLLSYQEPAQGGALIEVNMPDDIKAWTFQNRLHIVAWYPVTNDLNLGEKGKWLLDAVSWVPPALWCRQWSKSPAEVLDAALNGEWGEALARGFIEAAGRYGDEEWVETLVLEERTRHVLTKSVFRVIARLVSKIPAERLDAIIIKDLAGGKREGRLDEREGWLDEAAVHLLLELSQEWSDELSRAVVGAVKHTLKEIRGTKALLWHLSDALRQFASRVSHELADELSADWPQEMHEMSRKPVEGFLSIIAFRRDALRAIVKEEAEL
ncbi:MAG: hypothetical protein JOZ02_15595 [Acidobacteria bacterium]|nr:hypothetical protein [Acidobacteriota bacterium]